MPANQTSSPETQTGYHILRAWYLARLRKKISHAEERNLTPTALIQADRKAVEQLILQNEQKGAASTAPGARTLTFRRMTALWVSTAVVLPLASSIAILQHKHSQPSDGSAFWLITIACACAAVSGVIIWQYTSAWRRRILDLRAATNITRNDTTSNDIDMDELFDQLVLQLAEAVERERAIADYALDVFCSLSRDGRFLAVSPSAESLLGYVPAELMPISFYDLNIDRGPDSKKTYQDKLKNLSAAAPATSFESQFKCKDGSLKDLLWAAEWSASQNCIFMVAQDVTARSAVERLKQQFVQMVSHDLRAPLTALQITLSLLADGVYGELNEKGKRRVRNSTSDANRLINLINQLLDFERMESGKVDLVSEPCQVADIVEQSVEAVISLAEKQHLQLEVEVCKRQIHADGNKIIQVMVNLLGNAIKFSPPDTVIKVTGSEDEHFVELRVIDQGKGIPEHFKEKIFDRFQQVSLDDARLSGGSGLGLAISKAIVEAHGGSIGVESQEGKGSTFWIRLPCSDADRSTIT